MEGDRAHLPSAQSRIDRPHWTEDGEMAEHKQDGEGKDSSGGRSHPLKTLTNPAYRSSLAGVPPSSLDRLPDEIHTLVLTFALDQSSRRLHLFLLNKRTSVLAKKVWLDSWTPDEGVLQLLVRHSEVHSALRSFAIVEPCETTVAFEHECTMLSLFMNLTKLKISGWAPADEADSAGQLPLALTTTLTSLKHLRHLILEIACPLGLEDESFSIGRDLPNLEHLFIGASCQCSTRPLSPPCSGSFRSLTLATSGLPDTPYPFILWSSLTALPISLPSGNKSFRPIRELAKSLTAALFLGRPVAVNVPTPLPLRTLHLRNPVFEASAEPYRPLPDLTKPFELLPHLSLRKLVLETGLGLQSVSKMPLLATVEELVFHCGLDVASRSKDLLALHTILLGFPSLSPIPSLRRLGQHDDLEKARLVFPFLTRLPPPPLCALLMALRTREKLRTLVWRPGPETYVWTRGSVEEEFQVDRLRRF